MADENMVHFSIQPQENNKENEKNEMEIAIEGDIGSEEEFQALNKQLDQLNSALDTLERKNDDIQAELIDLLKSSREVRKQIQESSQE